MIFIKKFIFKLVLSLYAGETLCKKSDNFLKKTQLCQFLNWMTQKSEKIDGQFWRKNSDKRIKKKRTSTQTVKQTNRQNRQTCKQENKQTKKKKKKKERKKNEKK